LSQADKIYHELHASLYTEASPISESRRSVKKSTTRCHLWYFSRRSESTI